jgi:hypothetical protein
MITEHDCGEHSARSELTIEPDGRRFFRRLCTECGRVVEERRLPPEEGDDIGRVRRPESGGRQAVS